jgi:DivIVA domain-containing protein
MPEERLMSITSSPHLAPDDVARHTFGSVRRGFDPNEVRAYLESIAAGLRNLADREHQLLEELSEANHLAANPVLDEATLTSGLGNETARVLHSAHEVAAEMVAKAQAEAERLVSEAHEEIDQHRTRIEARLAEETAAAETAAAELSERTNLQIASGLEAARHEADELVSEAREQCRGMVEEAQGLRARVLADLSRRRKVLHAQIEQLRAGRERLTETVQDVRRSVDAIAEDLFAAEDNARLAAENAGREAAGRHDEGTPEELAALLLAEEAEAAADVALPLIDSGSPDDTGPDEVDDGSTAGADPERDPGDDQGAESPVDALFAKIRAAREETEEEEEPPAAETDPDVRTPEAPATEPVADDPVAAEDGECDDDGDESEDEPPEERNPLAVRRDELIDPIVTTLARRLKRTLQDNQNELLDSLRSKGSDWSIQLLPTEIEHVDSYATAALPALEEAAQAGLSFAGSGSGSGPSTDVLIGVAHDLAESVVGPLRRRLTADDGALAGAEEPVVVEFVGSAFREWKGERIERLAGDHVVAAFSAGTLAALEGQASTGLEWVAVAAPGDEPCPDCEDNGLNGSQPAGDEFPTGHRHPPAHPGCRCLLTRSST